MQNLEFKIKLSYVPGLTEIVLDELSQFKEIKVLESGTSHAYIEMFDDFEIIHTLKSVSRAYLVVQGSAFNPIQLSKHKSIVGNIIQIILDSNDKGAFKTFSISCAGSDTKEIKSINAYIEDTFKLTLQKEADMKIHIAKIGDIWEVGAQLTPRPLSVRSYRSEDMHGAMDATIAYALNKMCHLESVNSYLNVFSGSATLLIEAASAYPHLTTLIGFDNNKSHMSLSVRNIKKAHLIKKIKVHEANLEDAPDLGMFDVITSDLPFGMAVAKGHDLTVLYQMFIEYVQEHLNPSGCVGVYTSEFVIFEKCIKKSNLKIQKEIKINLMTSEQQFLPTKIFVLNIKGK